MEVRGSHGASLWKSIRGGWISQGTVCQFHFGMIFGVACLKDEFSDLFRIVDKNT